MARHRDEQKRELILKTSIRLFAEKGFHATSIQDIVSETGLSVGTIYLYFANKEEIFDSLLETGLDVFMDGLFSSAAEATSMKEIAEMFVSTIMDALQQNIDIVTVLTNELSFQEKLQDFYSKIARNISRKYLSSGDAESLYKTLKMTKKEFFCARYYIDLGNQQCDKAVQRLPGLMNMKDIRAVIQQIILAGMLERVTDSPE